ncbi:HAD family phosphatase [Georgenia daeguensis]|uniref:HAD-IA family hydrolase n=1 Tax=Georgenia daeguensis TaxID=908355 RepID=A0ABP6UQB4_9MICO
METSLRTDGSKLTSSHARPDIHGEASDPLTGYDTVVFDLGRVLVGWEPYLAVADQTSEEEWQAFAEAIDFPAVNLAMDGGLSHAAALARVRESHPQHEETLARYCGNFRATLTGPVAGTTAIVEALAAEGVRLLGLTNWSAETFHHAAEAAPVIDRLEDVLVSGREGVVKPDPAIFHLLIERYELRPGTTVFVDDSPANVAAAEGVGLRALHFTGAAQLRADLQNLGLLADGDTIAP